MLASSLLVPASIVLLTLQFMPASVFGQAPGTTSGKTCSQNATLQAQNFTKEINKRCPVAMIWDETAASMLTSDGQNSQTLSAADQMTLSSSIVQALNEAVDDGDDRFKEFVAIDAISAKSDAPIKAINGTDSLGTRRRQLTSTYFSTYNGGFFVRSYTYCKFCYWDNKDARMLLSADDGGEDDGSHDDGGDGGDDDSGDDDDELNDNDWIYEDDVFGFDDDKHDDDAGFYTQDDEAIEQVASKKSVADRMLRIFTEESDSEVLRAVKCVVFTCEGSVHTDFSENCVVPPTPAPVAIEPATLAPVSPTASETAAPVAEPTVNNPATSSLVVASSSRSFGISTGITYVSFLLGGWLAWDGTSFGGVLCQS